MPYTLQFSEDRETKEWILSIFGMNLDEDGFIVSDNDPHRKVLSRDGKELHIDEWIGIDKGSLAFVRGSPQEIVRMAQKRSDESA